MTTFTEIVAAVVVHSSAVALSHFGATMEPTQVERQPPAVERVIARTPSPRTVRVSQCPAPRPLPHERAYGAARA